MLEGTAAQSLRFTLHVVEKERIADNGVLNIWHALSTQLQTALVTLFIQPGLTTLAVRKLNNFPPLFNPSAVQRHEEIETLLH